MTKLTIKPKAIIFDIDGVLSNPDWRVSHAKKQDWDSFNELCEDDEPFKEVCLVCRTLFKDFEIIFLTGRPEKYRSKTVKWLIENVFNGYLKRKINLIMRQDGDHRRSCDYKLAEYKNIKEEYQVIAAFDDNDEVVKMYREQKVPTFALESMYND